MIFSKVTTFGVVFSICLGFITLKDRYETDELNSLSKSEKQKKIKEAIITITVSLIITLVVEDHQNSNSEKNDTTFQDNTQVESNTNMDEQAKESSINIQQILWEPKNIVEGDRVTFRVKDDIDFKENKVILQFADENGKFDDYNENINFDMGYVNGEWVYSQIFKNHEKKYFRVKVKNKYNNKEYISEDKEIDITNKNVMNKKYSDEVKDDQNKLNNNITDQENELYNNIKDNIKSGEGFEDVYTGVNLTASYIGVYNSDVIVSYPDGSIEEGSLKPGKTFYFESNKKIYRMIFYKTDYINKTYNVNLWESNPGQEIYRINKLNPDTKRYYNKKTNIEQGVFFKDPYTEVVFTVANIGTNFNDIIISYPDGTEDQDYCRSGKTFTFDFQGKKYKVVYQTPEDTNTYNVTVSELVQ